MLAGTVACDQLLRERQKPPLTNEREALVSIRVYHKTPYVRRSCMHCRHFTRNPRRFRKIFEQKINNKRAGGSWLDINRACACTNTQSAEPGWRDAHYLRSDYHLHRLWTVCH